MLNKKRLFALLMCIGLVLALLVSSTYIVTNAGHRCVGHNCDVCEHILQARTMMQLIALVGMLVAMLFMAGAGHRRMSAFDGIRLPARETLVGRKIRLND